MIAFIDVHREVYGVEPISRVLPITPSTYYTHVPKGLSRPGCRLGLGVMMREGFAVARCTIERLMREMALQGRRSAVSATATTILS